MKVLPGAIAKHAKLITFLEMFPIVVAINIWGASLKNKKILFHNDNQAVVAILNKKTSKSERVMALVRNFVLFTLMHNICLGQ
jgi:hypothetical protein